MAFNLNDNQDFSRSVGRAPEYSAVSGISFLNKVYGLMTAGLMLTGGVAHWVSQSVPPQQLRSWIIPCMVAELAVVFALSFLVMRMPAFLAFLGFLGYAALNGVTLSTIFLSYELGSVARVFAVTSCTYGAMTLYGFCTRRDLTSLGSLCMMALLGAVLAGVVNLFLKTSGLDFAMSLVCVLIFVGLTAYDAQKIKTMNENGVEHNGIAVMAALSLYLDFINLFLAVLRLLGKRK